MFFKREKHTGKIKEGKLVAYIGEFFNDNKDLYSQLSTSISSAAYYAKISTTSYENALADMESVSKELLNKIDIFIRAKEITPSDRDLLRSALMMQHNARLHSNRFSHSSYTYGSKGSNNLPDIIFFPVGGYYPYGYGGWGGGWGCYGWGHHHGGGSVGEKVDLVIIGIMLACIALAAAVGMATDVQEMHGELVNNQRVAANLATLALTAAFVAGAIVAAVAIFASNPVGWGAFAALALVVGVALLVKGTRLLMNYLDASMAEDSALASDSRFQLTPDEELNLQSNGYGEDDIDKIRGVIRGLALQASTETETSVIGSEEKYLSIIKTLTAVKKGDISPDLKNQYGITGPEAAPVSTYGPQPI